MKRRVRNRGLLDYPLRGVVRTHHTSGGNPLTNPVRTIFTLDCGHRVDVVGYFERKACRCSDCPRKAGDK